MTIGTTLAIYVQLFCGLLWWGILLRVVLSWISAGSGLPLFRLLIEVTEPVLGPLRRFLPTFGMIDLSPFVALLLIQVLQGIFLPGLARIGA